MTMNRKQRKQRKQSKPKRDLYQECTDTIIEAIESGTAPWRKGWKTLGGSGAFPVSGSTGKCYSGINVVQLWCVAASAGYTSNVWHTWKGADDKGGKVRGGERATPIVYWKFIEVDDRDNPGEKKKIPMLRYYSAFNANQIEWPEDSKWAPPVQEDIPEVDPTEGYARIAEVLEAQDIEVRHGGDRAFYRSDADSIQMPQPGQFDDLGGYWTTRAHEHVHSTGHANRLNRNLKGRFGSDAYAVEELVAELGAAFIAASTGVSLPDEPREDHAAYLRSWLKVLRADKKAIFQAATAAKKATEFLLEGAEVNTIDDQEVMQAAAK